MKIALECKPDERLAMGVGIPRRLILHQNDKGDVCKFLSKNNGNIGLIDEDPNGSQPKFLLNFSMLSNEHSVKFLKDKANNKIAVLCPRLEDWIVVACKVSGIDLNNFNLPDKPTELAKVINYKLSHFDRVVAALIESRNPGILRLKSFLN